jgi:hypothetical protein
MSECNKNSNYWKIAENFKRQLPTEYHSDLDEVFYKIKDYIEKEGFQIKVLNNCYVPFKGVRTKDYIIICSPQNFKSLADFVYILFHEIRHEIQTSKLKQKNPLSGDIENFEELYEMYWKMEMDAHNFGLEWVEKIKLPESFYMLSNDITNYPSMSNSVKVTINGINQSIKDLKSKGYDYSDISDLPLIKNIVNKLEELF